MTTNGSSYAHGAYEAYGMPATKSYGTVTDAVITEARAWIAAHRDRREPLTNTLKQWVLDPTRSLIELFADARRERLEQVHWDGQYFPNGKGLSPSDQSERLFNALAELVHERRVNNGSLRIQFHHPSRDELVRLSIGTQSLYTEAAAVYEHMRQAASADGVSLKVGSGYRSRQGHGDGISVAKGLSTHNYGLAMDLLLSTSDLSIREITTGLMDHPPSHMQNVIRMYRAPATKWMALNGAGWGWYPYRREPWHWEYNPPGFKERFENRRPATGVSAQAYDDDSAPQPAYGTPLALFEAYRGGLDAPDPGWPQSSALQVSRNATPAAQTFANDAVQRMKNFLVGNATGGHPQSCISTMNEALKQLFGRTNIRMGSEVQTTMGALHDQGLASDRHDIEFLAANGRDSRRGVLRPDKLKENVLDAALALANNERGWSVFGLSIMDGYHSVLLTVDNRDPQNRHVYWSDQWASRGGWKEFDRTTLDAEITKLTQSWWDSKPEGKKPRTRATLWRVFGP